MMGKIPLLSISFRPFFLLAALIAVLNPTFWISNYAGYSDLSFLSTHPLFWHGHEMLFGFSSALIAGFLFTASANWTGTRPYQGLSLLLLISVWLLERLSFFINVNEELFFVLLNLFFPTMIIMLSIKLYKFPKQRNVFIPILSMLFLGKLLYSYGHIFSGGLLEGTGKQVGGASVRLILLLISGRVIPFFTRAKLDGVKINTPNWLNGISLVSVLLLIFPMKGLLNSNLVSFLFLIAFLSNTARQLTWKPLRTMKVPILFVLHVGVFLVNLSLLLEFLTFFNREFATAQAPLHLLLAGGLGLLSIGIMSRVSLGHTGRIIKASKWTVFAYICVFIGAILRVTLPILNEDYYFSFLHTASGFWTLGFLIFLFSYSRILISQRPDGKEY